MLILCSIAKYISYWNETLSRYRNQNKSTYMQNKVHAGNVTDAQFCVPFTLNIFLCFIFLNLYPVNIRHFHHWIAMDVQCVSIDRFLFVCEDWLALDQSDGRLERCIPVTTKDTPYNSGLLLRHNANRKLTDDHLWFSVVSKQYWSQFTRVQRLSVCMATLFLTMVADAMWYNTGTKTSAGVFSFGPITLSMTEVTNSIISSIMVLPPVFLITYIFTHITSKHDALAETNTRRPTFHNILEAGYEEIKKSSKKFRCPAFCVYIGWLLVVLSVLVSAFFVILYSWSWEPGVSDHWLLAFCLSFSESVIIIQPAKVCHLPWRESLLVEVLVVSG